MPDMLTELRNLAQSWRDDAGAAHLGDPGIDHADALLAVIGEEPVLPVVAGLGQVTATLEIALSSVIIPGDDDRPEGLTLGHLVASSIAHRIMPDLGDLRERVSAETDRLITARVAELIDSVMGTKRHAWPKRRRRDLTLALMIEQEVARQIDEPDHRAMVRGHGNVPVLDAIIATAVTEAFRKLTADQARQITGKILADIASSGGR